jgi:hypothetical protein
LKKMNFSNHLNETSSRALMTFMEAHASLPNRPDLRCAPSPARRAGLGIASKPVLSAAANDAIPGVGKR